MSDSSDRLSATVKIKKVELGLRQNLERFRDLDLAWNVIDRVDKHLCQDNRNITGLFLLVSIFSAAGFSAVGAWAHLLYPEQITSRMCCLSLGGSLLPFILGKSVQGIIPTLHALLL